MTAATSTDVLRLVRTSADGPDEERATIRLVDGTIVAGPPAGKDVSADDQRRIRDQVDALLGRWRIDGTPDAQIFAELSQGGWSNGYTTIKP